MFNQIKYIKAKKKKERKTKNKIAKVIACFHSSATQKETLFDLRCSDASATLKLLQRVEAKFVHSVEAGGSFRGYLQKKYRQSKNAFFSVKG